MAENHPAPASPKPGPEDGIAAHEARLAAEHDGKHLLKQPTRFPTMVKSAVSGIISGVVGALVGIVVGAGATGNLNSLTTGTPPENRNHRMIIYGSAAVLGILTCVGRVRNKLRLDKQLAIAKQAPEVIEKYNEALKVIDETAQKNEKNARHAVEETKILRAENETLGKQLKAIIEEGPRSHKDFAEQTPQEMAI